jgi:oligopeptide/dipeptide ABC transporter ATP-binding protein
MQARRHRLTPIRGNPPNVQDLPPGCSYAPRCRHAQDVCTTKEPPLVELGAGQLAACIFAPQLQKSGELRREAG